MKPWLRCTNSPLVICDRRKRPWETIVLNYGLFSMQKKPWKTMRISRGFCLILTFLDFWGYKMQSIKQSFIRHAGRASESGADYLG